MDHTYMQGPVARASQKRRALQLKKMQKVQYILLAFVVLAFLLGAMHADNSALQAGLIH